MNDNKDIVIITIVLLEGVVMSNLSKIKRERIIETIKNLRTFVSNSASVDSELLAKINELETEVKDKKYGIVYENHIEETDIILENNVPVLIEDKERVLSKDESKPWNFIIEGDNLQVLKLLEKTHKGKIDLIYIDPPYNTGAKDWKYNNDYVSNVDLFKHSKWLSMMEKRLRIASKLLKSSGVIVCSIDDYEVFQLGMLMDEIFNEDNRLGLVTVVHKPEGRNQEKFFATSNEFALFYAKDISKCKFRSVIITEEKLNEFDHVDHRGRYKLQPLIAKNHGRAGEDKNLRINRPHKYYPIYVSQDCKKISLEEFDDSVAIYPVTKQERTWKYDKETCIKKIDEGEIVAKAKGKTIRVYEKYRVDKGELIKTHWIKKEYNANVYGTKILTDIIEQGVFDFPKSLYLIKDILNITTPEDGIVLDFFAGSGTTGHAVNLLNAEDGGNRNFIMVTNNEISDKEAKEFTLRGLKKGDPEWEARGIAKYITWPRTVSSINGVDVKGNPLKGEYVGSNIPMSQGFISNVKYMKVGFVPKDRKFYNEYSDKLLLHVKELVELENGINFTENIEIAIILSDEELDKFAVNIPVECSTIYLGHDVLPTYEQNQLFKERNIKINIIPDYYYKELEG